MFYYRLEDDIINKYEVSYDIDRLEEIKSEIIDNASIITHEEYDSSYKPRFKDKLFEIRNYKEEYKGSIKHFIGMEDIYHINFDKYTYSPLVNIINELLINNTKSLEELYNYNPKDNIYYNAVVRTIDTLQLELETDNYSLKQKRLKIEEMEHAKKTLKKYRKQHKKELYYKEKIKEEINLKKVDTISFDEVNKVENFFDNKPKILKKANKRSTNF